MNVLMDKKIKNIFIIIFIIIILIAVFLNFRLNRLFINKKNMEIDLDLETETLDLNVGKFKNTKINIFSSNLTSEQLDNVDGSKVLLLFRLNSLWHRVYFNDIEIGGSGGFFDDKFNSSNEVVMYNIPKNLVQGNNSLVIESYNYSDINKNDCDFMILDHRNAAQINYFISNFTFGIVYFILGLAFAQLIIFVIYLIFFNKKSKYWPFIIGIFFIGLAQIRYLSLYLNTINLLIFKKITLIALLLSLFFVCYGFYYIYKSRRNLFVGLINLILAFVITAQTNMLNVLIIEKYLIVIILVTVINWMITAKFDIENEMVNKVIFLGSFILFISLFSEKLLIIFTNVRVELSLFGIIIFIISLSSIVISDIEELFVIVQKHREQSEQYYDKSIKDQMTDLYNMEFIRNELYTSDYKYSLIMFDIDDFKSINDNFGHDIGDEAIIKVANISQHMIRRSDIVGRYGGDEFIIIAKECTAENAYKIAKQIKDKIESQTYIEKNEINIRISMGIYENFDNHPYEVALKNVDDRLYMAKAKGKSNIVWNEDG